MQLKLIDGTFEPKEAKELLLALYTNKIKYHALKNFSSHIRTGVDEPHSRIRIAELESCKELIVTLMTRDTEGKLYRITSDVKIDLLEDQI